MIQSTITFDKIQLFNADNMEVMKQYPDKYFDIAIVDQPYGIDKDGGKIGGDNCGKAKNYTKKDWDSMTEEEREHIIKNCL